MTNAITQTIERLRKSVAEGKHWYVALLEAVHKWSVTEEDYDGRNYRYLLDNEAFDWLLLAERLCPELDGLVPENEVIDLLFFGAPPTELSEGEFRTLIGSAKYRTYLNYFYGVVVERFLVLALTEESRKKRRALGLSSDDGVLDEVHHRIYGADRGALIEEFRREKRYPHLRSMSLQQLDEFTYWLFKRRVERSEKSCVASDTKKALGRLHDLVALSPRAPGTAVTRRARSRS